ncbi:MAG: hypothetical protein KDC44_18215 [Phaeodactylibacter sp.]|nr:hypothetical protein [Phaeodactylibacter sp.]
MKMKPFFLRLFPLLLVMACQPEDEMQPEPQFLDYSGTYQGALTHIRLGEQYDPLTGETQVGYDTLIVDPDHLEITRFPHSLDSFWIDEVIFYTTKVQAKAWLVNDTLFFEYDESTSIHNRYSRGMMWYETTELKVEYHWDNMDTWSTGALPEQGDVTGTYTAQ